MSGAPVRRLTIATRESALALKQAEHIRARFATLYPGAAVELLGITTQGDRVQDKSLAEIGGTPSTIRLSGGGTTPSWLKTKEAVKSKKPARSRNGFFMDLP